MRKLIAALTAICMVFAALPGFAVEITDMAQVTFRIDNAVVSDGRLTPGRVTASVQTVVSKSDGKYLASLGYYDSHGKLTDFSAKTVTVAPMGQFALGSATLSLDVLRELEDGASVRVIVMDARTLEPMTVNNSTLVYKAPVTDADTGYDGIYERYYRIVGDGGEIKSDGAALSVADEGTSYRLKNMGGGWVGFADGNRRIYNNEGAPGRRLYGFGSTTMLWRLVPEGDGYYIQSYDGGYLAIDGGEVALTDEPYPFTLIKTGETPFTLATATEGYKLLTEAQKQRLTEICTSPGATALPNGTNGKSLLDIVEDALTVVYDTSGSTSPEEQKAAILAAMGTTVSYNAAGTNEINAVKITDLPGGDAEISQSGPVKEKIYIWDTGEKEYSRLDVTYTGFGHSQTVKFYYDETGETNVRTAIQALARFPWEYRQFIQQVNVYVPASSFTYNCDGKILTVRVTDGTNVESMARNFAHELGHSIEFLANGAAYEKPETHWCHSEEWQKAIEDDILPVSEYGSSNSDEGLAEFARLYFQSWGSHDLMEGVKTLYPNRYASFNKLLKNIGMEPLY